MPCSVLKRLDLFIWMWALSRQDAKGAPARQRPQTLQTTLFCNALYGARVAPSRHNITPLVLYSAVQTRFT